MGSLNRVAIVRLEPMQDYVVGQLRQNLISKTKTKVVAVLLTRTRKLIIKIILLTLEPKHAFLSALTCDHKAVQAKSQLVVPNKSQANKSQANKSQANKSPANKSQETFGDHIK